ncbi:MAG: hypothetical protein LUE31_10275 [Lachnospiraceae bacterium]|nr:hypothetical protein [Lachnospiraceae bacterium]
MAEPDGSIIIDTTLDEKGFTAGSERLNAAVKLLRKKVDELGPTLQNAVNGSLGDLTALKEQFAAVSAEAAGVEKEIRDFGETKVETEQYRRVCENLERAEQDLEKLRDRQELMDDVGIDISPQIDRAINDVKRLQAARDELEQSGGAYEDVSTRWDYGHLQRGIQAAKNPLAAQLEQLEDIPVSTNTEPAQESIKQLRSEAEKPIQVPIVPEAEKPDVPETEAVKVPVEPVVEKQVQIKTPEEIQVPGTPVAGEAVQIETPEPIEVPVTPTAEKQVQIETPEPVDVPVIPTVEGQAQIEAPDPVKVPVKPVTEGQAQIETPAPVEVPVKPILGNVPEIETPEDVEIPVKPVVENVPAVEAPKDIEIQVKPVIENIPQPDVQEDVTVPVKPEIDRQAASAVSDELAAAMQDAERAMQELNAELDKPDDKIRNAGKASVYLKESLQSAGKAAAIFIRSFASNAPVESLDDARAAMSDCAASAKKYGAAVRDFLNHPRGKQQTTSELEQYAKDLNDAAEQLRQAAGESMGKSFESSGVNVTTLQNKITSLLNQTERLESAFQKAMSGGEQEMATFESKARILNRTFEDTIQRGNKFGQTEFQTDEYKRLDHDLQAAAKHYETLLTEKERYEYTGTKENSKEWRNLIFRLQQAEHQYQQLSGAAERMKQAGNATFQGTDTAEYQQMAQALADVTAKFAQMNSAAAQAGSGASRIGTALKNVGKKALQAAAAIAKVVGQAALTGLKRLGSLAGNAAKSLLGLDKSARKSSGSFKSGFGTILKYGLGIRSLYTLVNKLRSALVEGYENLAQYSVETNAAISSVKSALTQLKNSFATAFAPILTVVAPILSQLINMLSTAITYLGMFFAALTGQTSFTKAIAVQEDYADSLSATGSAAEAAQKPLAGFAELNVRSDSSGSGGSGTGTYIPDKFETLEIEPYDF